MSHWQVGVLLLQKRLGARWFIPWVQQPSGPKVFGPKHSPKRRASCNAVAKISWNAVQRCQFRFDSAKLGIGVLTG